MHMPHGAQLDLHHHHHHHHHQIGYFIQTSFFMIYMVGDNKTVGYQLPTDGKLPFHLFCLFFIYALAFLFFGSLLLL